MGVRGLKSFIEKQDGLLETHNLHDSTVVIDANNLICAFFVRGQKHERSDLFGGNMVQYGRYLTRFYDNLRACKIRPILIFDGAQTYDENKSKTAEKFRRAMDRFQNVLSINKLGFGDFTLPTTATNVFRSIAVDLDIEIIQCMYEADAEVARIANDLKSPVISNDSDFFLMNLNYGLIPIDSLRHEQVKTHTGTKDGDQSYHYIECSLYKQAHFAKYIPTLDVGNLALLGVLAGNDYVESKTFDRICSRLPLQRIYGASLKPGIKSFRKVTNNKQHEKILKILHYLSGRSLNETINLICSQVSKDKRLKLKEFIKANLLAYKIPPDDDFKRELGRLYWRGFSETYGNQFNDDPIMLKNQFEATIDQLTEWLKGAMEHSVLGYRCLELANHNNIFIMEHMDDPTLSSAHGCQIRNIQVMLTLMRSSYGENKYCNVYSRIGNRYRKLVIRPLKHLNHAGTLNYTLFDIPTLSPSMRKTILLATFHASPRNFDENINAHLEWFDEYHAEEFLTTKLLLDFIDIEYKDARLWKQFRQATLLCMMYHYYKDKRDDVLLAKLDDVHIDVGLMDNLVSLIKARKLDKTPILTKKRLYDCRLMHQITQLQSSIVCFNTLNAFLGDVMNRIRTEVWLNSCLIYNMAESIRLKTIRLPNLPQIIHDRTITCANN